MWQHVRIWYSLKHTLKLMILCLCVVSLIYRWLFYSSYPNVLSWNISIFYIYIIYRNPGVSCDWHYASGWCTICRLTQRWAWCQQTRATRSASEVSVPCRVPVPATLWPPTYPTPLATQGPLRASAAASRRLCRYEVWSLILLYNSAIFLSHLATFVSTNS